MFARTNHLRERRQGHARVIFVELFFGPVFVFAVTHSPTDVWSTSCRSACCKPPC